jgi:hypothetical protein
MMIILNLKKMKRKPGYEALPTSSPPLLLK